MKKNILRQLIMLSKRLMYAFLIQLFMCTVLLANTGNAQRKTIEEVKVSLNLQEKTLLQFFRQVESKTEFKFTYNDDLVDLRQKVTVVENNHTLYQVLESVSRQTELHFVQVNENIHVKSVAGQAEQAVEIVQMADVTVSGTVTDNNGEPIPGVTVSLPGTTVGTATDLDGRYTLTVPEGSTLVFSFIGFETQNISIGDRSVVDVVLAEDVSSLDEVVVVGYGTQKKSELTGAIATISPDDINKIPVHNPLNALQGRVAGLHITTDGTPGGGTRSVSIRGFSTLGNNNPLFIIDGQPITGYSGSQALDFMNPNDIESIQVLKDAAASSIYGSRASGGVIIITTKKASSGAKVEVSSSATIQNFYNSPEMLNTEQRGITYWRASVNDGLNPNLDNPHYTYDWGNDEQGNPVLHNLEVIEWLDKEIQGGIRSGNTDWFKEVSRPGYIVQNNVSISKGGEDHSILFSLGHYYNQGAIKYTDYQRTSVRVNSSIDLFDGKVTIGENFQFVTSNRTPMGSGQGGSVFSLGFITSPIIPVYAEDGSFAGPVSGLPNRMNPLQVADLTKDYKNNMRQVFGNIYLKYKVTNDLEFQSNYGIDYRDREHLTYDPTFESGFLKEVEARYSRSLPQDYSWTWHNTLSYNFKFREHEANILAGMEAIAHTGTEFSINREGYLLENPNYMHASSGTGVFNISGSETGNQLLSYFSKVSYSYLGKYLLSGTLRYDGSSRFGENNRFGFFPAASAGWRISSEPFFGENFISNLLFRVGFGRTGNQEIGNNAAFGLYSPAYDRLTALWQHGSAYDIHGSNSGTLPSGVVADQLQNPNLRWEQTEELNIGVDFEIKDGKFNGYLDYFFRDTKDILIRPPYLAVYGEGGSQWQNGASMKNSGWEVQLGYRNILGDLNYRANLTVASFKDKVTHVPASTIRAYPGNVEQTIIGRSITSLFGYKTDGIFQNESEVDSHSIQPGAGVGRIRYKDLNEDGVINELDQSWLGATIPDFEYGLNLVFGYKNFSLTAFIQGVQGLTLHNGNENQNVLIGSTLAGQNQSTRALDAWTPQNPKSQIPALSKLDDNNESRPSDFQIQDASYLKLRNLQFGYTLPDTFLNSAGIGKAEIYLSGTQLITISSKDWTGTDPENPSTYYPITRGITLGVNATF